MAALAASVLPSTARARAHHHACYRASGVRQEVIRRHGGRAAGRNICRRGVPLLYPVFEAHSARLVRTRSATAREKRAYLARLRKVLAPPVRPIMERIAACESGGNPRAIGGGGAFRGKFQFTYGTWAGVGGRGDPAAASEAEQDRRAWMLYLRSGPAPWPVCGRR